MSGEKERKVLSAAKGLFLRYGYKRVNMHDIAEAAGISRPALYLVFRSKEEIFRGAYKQWADETIASIEEKAAVLNAPEEKLRLAFELWFVLPFEAMKTSPELKELVECSFSFAQDSLNMGYRRFEKSIEIFLRPIVQARFSDNSWTTERTAHLLVSAVRGLKEAAETSDKFLQLIDDLLSLTLGAHSRMRRIHDPRPNQLRS
jgi:AcrR family transcriptional regulator